MVEAINLILDILILLLLLKIYLSLRKETPLEANSIPERKESKPKVEQKGHIIQGDSTSEIIKMIKND